MPTVFISHATKEDAQFARRLAGDLRRLGLQVWIAPGSIRPGEDWVAAINRGLSQSSHMLIVLTPAAVESGWVEMETNTAIALERKKRIQVIPLDVKPCEVPPLLSLYQKVSFRRDYDAGLRQLADRLGVRVTPPKPEVPVPFAPKAFATKALGRGALLAGGLVLVVLLGIGGYAIFSGYRRAAERVAAAQTTAVAAAATAEAQATAAAPTEVPTPTPVVVPTDTLTPEMVLIPAGEFLMGSDPSVDKYAREAEQPQHTLYLPDYYLAKTPVTNAQYAAFVQATYRQPEGWEAGKPPSGKEDHPVVDVSWHDAVAYCDWLSEVTGRPYRLPSEAEWEKGARGTDGRIWPWGNEWDVERCNSAEGGKGDTTPVGAYPEGASPYGLLDMAGNVWEWTRSLWGEDLKEPSFKYPYDPDDGREDLEAPDTVRRVLRGGSWDSDRDFARCVGRLWYRPNLSLSYIGFRLVSPVGSDF